MRRRWRISLPTLGLFLLGVGSYVDFRMDRETPPPSNRYFWWSSIRLDRDPLGRNSQPPAPRQYEDGGVGWDPATRWVTPGPMAKFLMISALPAFAVGGLAVCGFGRLGGRPGFGFFVFIPPPFAA